MRYVTDSPEHGSQLETLKKVENLAGVSLSHITVVLESRHFSSDTAIRADFKVPAFCWRQGDLQDGAPASVAALMDDQDCQRLIWLSKSLVEGDQVHLAWVFAHEICHVLQFNCVRSVASLQVQLRELLAMHSHLRTGTQLNRADELDSELFAKSLTRRLFGAVEFEAYLSRQRIISGGAAYHAHLELLESSLCGAN
jgi:hypothetical protein